MVVEKKKEIGDDERLKVEELDGWENYSRDRSSVEDGENVLKHQQEISRE